MLVLKTCLLNFHYCFHNFGYFVRLLLSPPCSFTFSITVMQVSSIKHYSSNLNIVILLVCSVYGPQYYMNNYFMYQAKFMQYYVSKQNRQLNSLFSKSLASVLLETNKFSLETRMNFSGTYTT